MTLVEQIGLVQRRIERLVRQRIAQTSDRPFLQLRALRAVRNEALHTQAAFAERLRIDAPAASRLIDRLVADRLLRRKPGRDRRCIRVELTAAGRAELAALDAAIAYAEKVVRAHLGGKATALTPTLAELADRLAAA